MDFDQNPYTKKELLALAPDQVDEARLIGYVRNNLHKASQSLFFEIADCDKAEAEYQKTLNAIMKMGHLHDYAIVCQGFTDKVFCIDVAVQPNSSPGFYYIPIRITHKVPEV